MLTAGIVLGIMVIPFIAAVAREVFSAVPAPLRESAVALGSTRWEVLSRVTLPYTRSAVIGAIFLGLGRALGETMAVTFVLGNAHDLSASLLMPSNSIAAAIANEFTEADTDLYRSSLIALGFLLFVVTLHRADDREIAPAEDQQADGKDPLMAIPARRRAPMSSPSYSRRCDRVRPPVAVLDPVDDAAAGRRGTEPAAVQRDDSAPGASGGLSTPSMEVR